MKFRLKTQNKYYTKVEQGYRLHKPHKCLCVSNVSLPDVWSCALTMHELTRALELELQTSLTGKQIYGLGTDRYLKYLVAMITFEDYVK